MDHKSTATKIVAQSAMVLVATPPCHQLEQVGAMVVGYSTLAWIWGAVGDGMVDMGRMHMVWPTPLTRKTGMLHVLRA